jgi:deazaflavin-dependent oxidoreductase (nitroreductase family)
MAERFLYLTTTGRKSGLPRSIEIWFVEHAGRHYLVSERREASGWVRNIRNDPRVHFSIGTREAPEEAASAAAGRGRVVEDGAEPELLREVRALMDAKYGWSDGLVVELSHTSHT